MKHKKQSLDKRLKQFSSQSFSQVWNEKEKSKKLTMPVPSSNCNTKHPKNIYTIIISLINNNNNNNHNNNHW